MAVIQISKIQVRRGLEENLPSLAAGELGWSVDSRRLYIGNGTLSEGSPATGRTEVLTIYSPVGAALSNIAVIEANISALTSQVANIAATSYSSFTPVTLADSTTLVTNTSVVLQSLNSVFDYNIVRGTIYRVGSVKVTSISNNVYYEDDYSETGTSGVTLSFAQYGPNIVMRYTTTTSGVAATLNLYTPRLFV